MPGSLEQRFHLYRQWYFCVDGVATRILEEMVFAEAVMLDEVREVTTVFVVAGPLQVFEECVPERCG